jgi:hypothetical protein
MARTPSASKLIRYGLRNRFQGMDSASLCNLGQYDNHIPTCFLAPIDCNKIPAHQLLKMDLVRLKETSKFVYLSITVKYRIYHEEISLNTRFTGKICTFLHIQAKTYICGCFVIGSLTFLCIGAWFVHGFCAEDIFPMCMIWVRKLPLSVNTWIRIWIR